MIYNSKSSYIGRYLQIEGSIGWNAVFREPGKTFVRPIILWAIIEGEKEQKERVVGLVADYELNPAEDYYGFLGYIRDGEDVDKYLEDFKDEIKFLDEVETKLDA